MTILLPSILGRFWSFFQKMSIFWSKTHFYGQKKHKFSNFFHENTKKNQVVGSNGRGAGGNNGEWVRRDGKWVQLEEKLDQRPILNV